MELTTSLKWKYTLISVIVVTTTVLIFLYISLDRSGLPLFIIRRNSTTPSENAVSRSPVLNHSRQYSENTVHVALSSCGSRSEEALVLIKSAVLLSRSKIMFHIFTDESSRQAIALNLDGLQQTANANFSYQIYDSWFPERSKSSSLTWANLFRPCASQRLFLHRCLTSLDAVLYLDTDTLFLTSPQTLWDMFRKFNSSHVAGMAPNQVTNVSSFYDLPNTVPHYGPKGLNSGVMLLNLTRLRAKPWEEELALYYQQHKRQIQLGDQDLLNVYFHHHPEEVFLCPCGLNYRSDYCFKTLTCRLPPLVLHGNRFVWHNNLEPAFKAVYSSFKAHSMGAPLRDLPIAVCKNLNAAPKSKCGNVSDVFVEELSRQFQPELHINQTLCTIQS